MVSKKDPKSLQNRCRQMQDQFLNLDRPPTQFAISVKGDNPFWVREKVWSVGVCTGVDFGTLAIDHPYTEKLISDPAMWPDMLEQFTRIKDDDTAVTWVNHYGLPVQGCLDVEMLVLAAEGVKWLSTLIEAWLSPEILQLEQSFILKDRYVLGDIPRQRISQIVRALGLPEYIDGSPASEMVRGYLSLSPAEQRAMLDVDLHNKLQRTLQQLGDDYCLWTFGSDNSDILSRKLWFYEANPVARGIDSAGSKYMHCESDAFVGYYSGDLRALIRDDSTGSIMRLLCARFLQSVFDKAFEHLKTGAWIELDGKSLSAYVNKRRVLKRPLDLSFQSKTQINNPLDCMYLSLFQKLMKRQPGKNCKICGEIFLPKNKKGEFCSSTCRSKKHRNQSER